MKRIFLASCLFTFIVNVQAQYNTTVGKVTISSPDAAALGKYGDIPVSYHTGIPNIAIPIYTIKSGPLELPIGLSYHASGLKVQEQASSVGAGWALNAGGVITRTVVGAPDDKGVGAYATDRGHFSDWGYNNYLFSSGPGYCSTSSPLTGIGNAACPTGSLYGPQDGMIQSGKFDGEPDLYFFNFGAYTGKFYFNDDRTPVIVPQQDLKITPIYPGHETDSRGLIGFIVTTPDGTKYFFGKNQEADGNVDAVEITDNVTTQSSFTGHGVTSSWFLNKIASADDQFVINLIYAGEHYSYFTLSMFPVSAVPNPNIGAFNAEYDLDKNLINGVRLSKITFAKGTGTVNFNPGSLRQDMGGDDADIADHLNDNTTTGARTLGSISITATGFCKQFSFAQSYFYDATSPLTGDLSTRTIETDKYRLRLDSIQELSCDNTIKIPPYKFAYSEGLVPRKLTFGIDHWGFYNGITSNTTLIPTYTIVPSPTSWNGSYPNGVTTVAGANREADWQAGISGNIKQIFYPTGGRTDFEFEWNDIYSSSTSFQSQSLMSPLTIHDFGQAARPMSATIEVDASSSSVDMAIFSDCNYSGYLTIVNSAGIISYQTPINNISGTTPFTYNPTVPLSPGIYVVTLTAASYTGVTGHIRVDIAQQQQSTVTASLPVGGVRIKTISSFDNVTQKSIVTNYGYNFDNDESGRSSGVLYSRPIYVQPLRNDAWAIVNGDDCSPFGCFTCLGSDVSYYKSPSSIRPMASSQGNHIGYGEVTVSQTGNGSTVYRYYNSSGTFSHYFDPPQGDVCVRTITTFCAADILNSPAAPDPYVPIRGELAYKAHMNESGQLLEKTNYFPQFQQDSLVTPGLISKFFVTNYLPAAQAPPMNFYVVDGVPIPGGDATPSFTMLPVGVNTFTEYYLRSARRIQDSTVTTQYDPATGASIVSTNTVTYGSRYHSSPTLTSSFSSKGERIVTVIKNSFDFRSPGYSETNELEVYGNALTSDESYLSSALATTGTHTSNAHYYWDRLNLFTNYRFKKAQDRTAFRLSMTTAKTGYTAALSAAINVYADASLKPVMKLQNEFINTPIESHQLKNDNLLSAQFITYGQDLDATEFVYPAKIQTIDVGTVAVSTPTGFTGASVSGYSLNKDSRYADETSLTYKKGNLATVKKRDGVINSYIWGYQNQYPVARVIGAAYTPVISALSDAVLQSPTTDAQLRTELDQIRTGFPDAQVVSYTYSHLKGMTSQTDVSGRTSYYEYDALSRLQLVRDQNSKIVKQYDYKYSALKDPNNCVVTCTNFSGIGVAYYSIYFSNMGGGPSFTNIHFTGTGTVATIPIGTYIIGIGPNDFGHQSSFTYIINGYLMQTVPSLAYFISVPLTADGLSIEVY